MKAQILKIAGVKTEAEFYKKYPTEEAFMKKHGKELKKAQVGASLKTTGSLKPQGLSSSAKALPTLTSPVAASTGAFNQSVDGADFFGNTTSNYGYDPNAYIPSPNENSGNSFKSKIKGIASRIKQGMQESTEEADLSVPSGLAGMIGGITSGISTINQTKKNIKELGKYAKISDVAATAATSRPERSRRMYVRPEDNLVTGINPLGTRDGLLAAKNGTEIANTFAPNDIYTDMGYEPLNDSNKVKAFKKGGKIKKAEIGAMMGMANSAADLSRASGQLGGLLGSQWGGAGGETGGYSQALGGFGLIGGIAGGLLDAPMLKKQKQAQNYINNNLALTNMQSGMNSPHMENGGWMNPEYNPQVIAKFGDYDVKDLLKPPHDADMLRAGGHLKEYTPPSARAMYTGRDLPYQMEDGGQMAMGGDLQVHRGKAETMSYNPFLPNGGESVMFRGPSHENGGMPISFGQNGVEVEGGEPAQILQDGGDVEEGNDGKLIVFGNMIKPGTDQKFKNYVDDLNNKEAKQNKLVDRTMTMIDNVDGDDPFDQLSLNTGRANLLGAEMKLKDIAIDKMDTAGEQNAILDTAKEFRLDSDALSKGKIKPVKPNDPYAAEFGAELDMAQKGKKVKKKKSTLITTPSKDISTLSSFVKNIPLSQRKAMAKAMGIPNYQGKGVENEFLFKKQSYTDRAPLKAPTLADLKIPTTLGLNKDQIKKAMDASIARRDYQMGNDVDESTNNTYLQDAIITGANSILPFVRPTNQLPLDPSQLAGEMYAMSQNQEEPVFAQSYQPMMTQPISISLQDQLNEITSQARAAERMAQGNPAALSMIAAQAADAKNKVLGEQFRMNQGEAQRVAETNRQTMNEAQKMNLGLYDQQQQRVAQARSNTKMQNIAILNSVSDKIAKNRLENRELGVMENLYNYRFTPSGVAYNVNPPARFAPLGSGSGGTGSVNTSGLIPDYGTDEATGKPKIIGYKLPKEKNEKTKKRNGAIVKAIKGL